MRLDIVTDCVIETALSEPVFRRARQHNLHVEEEEKKITTTAGLEPARVNPKDF